MTRSIKHGILFALAAATISGLSIFYNKLVIVKGVDPHVYNIVKNGGAAVCLMLLLFLHRRKPVEHLFSSKRLRVIVLIGLFGGGIPFILYFEGLRTVSAVSANLIHKSMFLWVACMAIFFLGERLRAWQVTGYILVAAGTVILGGFDGFSGSSGELLLLAATLLWSVEHVVVKRIIKTGDAGTLAFGRMLFGLPVLVTYVFVTGKMSLFVSLPSALWASAAGSILLLTAYVWTWYQALERAPVTVVTSLLILAVPVTSILSGVFLTHTLSLPDVVGTTVLVAGAVAVTMIAGPVHTPGSKKSFA